jgi:hypothetical protein
MRFVLRGSRLTVVAAAVALLTALPMSALPLLHRLADDDFCSPSAVQHDAAAHHIGLRTEVAGSSHCAICHWDSTRRFKAPTLLFAPTAALYVGLVAKAPPVDPPLVAIASRPARAPPLT